MADLSGLCILAFFALFMLMILMMLMRGGSARAGGPTIRRERPQYDDPEVRSSGGFGSPAPRPNPTYDDPNVRSGGSFGGRPRFKNKTRGASSGPSLGTRPNPRREGGDDDNIRSRGSFGS